MSNRFLTEEHLSELNERKEYLLMYTLELKLLPECKRLAPRALDKYTSNISAIIDLTMEIEILKKYLEL